MAAQELTKENITQSNIVDGGGIVIEDIKWGVTNEQSVLTNAQRTIEDMMDLATQSRVRLGLGVTTAGSSSTFTIGSGAGLINGRWLRLVADTDI